VNTSFINKTNKELSTQNLLGENEKFSPKNLEVNDIFLEREREREREREMSRRIIP